MINQYYITNSMKPNVPAANVIVAFIYLLLIIAIGYVLKLIFKWQHNQQSQKRKYTMQNYSKGLINPKINTHIQPIKVVVHSYIMKYNIVGAIMNPNKNYLLKQMFIVSIMSVICSSINRITIWPVALALTFAFIFFVLMQIGKIPMVWSLNSKIQEQKKIGSIDIRNIQIQPQLPTNQNINEHSSDNSVKKINNSEPYFNLKQLISLSIVSFLTFILLSQTMFTIFNSVSNLGAFNLGSVLSIVMIDQFAVRALIGLLIFAAAKIVLYQINQDSDILRSKSSTANENNLEGHNNGMKLFERKFFRHLCEDKLIQRMNEIINEFGEENCEMGASPTKKKCPSPSKIPKALNLPEKDEQSLMKLEGTKKQDEMEEQLKGVKQIRNEQMNYCKSPIRQIQLSMIKESMLFTSIQKKMFEESFENDSQEINKAQNQTTEKIKIIPNQFFSAQRLPKDEINHEEHLEDDGLVLVEAGLNLVRQKEGKGKVKPNTIDIQFSPTKKRKKTMGAQPNKRRQLIITGSSPYLQYLPDMMKKEKQNKKNITPGSANHIPTVSRKVL